MRKKIKAIMGRMHQENLELDEPAERFLSSLKTSTAKGYRGDVDCAVKCLTEAGLLLDTYRGRSRVVAPNFRRWDLLFIRGQGWS